MIKNKKMKIYLVRNDRVVDCGFVDKNKAKAYLKGLRNNDYYYDFYISTVEVIE